MARHRPLQVLIKPASADCNLACRYCFYLEKSALYPESRVHRMSAQVQEEMVRQILLYGGAMPSFSYQGGEPTLMGLDYFRRAADLQRRYAAPGTTICNSMQTNGLLIDEEWAAFLAQYRFLVGLSLDGPPDLHDHYRVDLGGHPTHERVLRAARILSDYQVEYNILSVVSNRAAGRGAEVYRYLVDQGWRFLQFIPAVEFDPATGQLADFSVRPGDFGRFMCDVFDEWKKDFQDGRPTVSVRLFDALLALACGLAAPACTFRKRCGNYVVIEYNGDVYSCDFFVDPRWRLGNLMNQSLRSMAEGARQREFGDLKAQLPRGCEGCEYLRICYGGCLKDRMRSSGPGELGADYFCEAWRMIFGHTEATFKGLRPLVEAERAAAERAGKPWPPVEY